MSIVSLDIGAENPVTRDTLNAQLDKLRVSVPEVEARDLQNFLAAFHDLAVDLDLMDDYIPASDIVRFPRKNVKAIMAADQLGAWVYKFDIVDENIQGLLTGKTMSVKDNICVAGIPQTLGTNVWEPWTPESDATVVKRALEAGVHIIGTNNCEALCLFTGSHTSSLATVQNPYAHGYTAGGSSSGSAAAVSAGNVDMSIGADQGGSIRIPSAFCGLVGLKPTFGLVPYTGIVPLVFTIDHAGPMTRTVEENAKLLQVIAGTDGWDDRQVGAPAHVSFDYKNPRKLKLGLLKEAFEVTALDSAMRQKILKAVEVWKKLGYEIEEVSVPMHKKGPQVWTIIERFSGLQGRLGRSCGRRIYSNVDYAKHAKIDQTFFDNAPPTVKNSIINGLYLTETFPGLYEKATNLSLKLRDSYDEVLKHVDILIAPTVPFVAPKHGSRSGRPLDIIKNVFGVNMNTCPFNVSGHPAMSLPIGWLPAEDNPDINLPAAVQLIGKYFDEESLYTAAYAYEQACSWKENW